MSSPNPAPLRILPALTDEGGIRHALLQLADGLPGNAGGDVDGDELFTLLLLARATQKDEGAWLRKALESSSTPHPDFPPDRLVDAAIELAETMDDSARMLRGISRNHGSSMLSALSYVGRTQRQSRNTRRKMAGLSPALRILHKQIYQHRMARGMDAHDVLFLIAPNVGSNHALRERVWSEYVRELRKRRTTFDSGEDSESAPSLMARIRMAWMDYRLQRLISQNPRMGAYAGFETGYLWRQRLVVFAALLALVWVAWFTIHLVQKQERRARGHTPSTKTVFYHAFPGDF